METEPVLASSHMSLRESVRRWEAPGLCFVSGECAITLWVRCRSRDTGQGRLSGNKAQPIVHPAASSRRQGTRGQRKPLWAAAGQWLWTGSAPFRHTTLHTTHRATHTWSKREGSCCNLSSGLSLSSEGFIQRHWKPLETCSDLKWESQILN